MQKIKQLLPLVVIFSSIVSCNSNNEDETLSDGTASEVAMAAVGGVSSASEGTITAGLKQEQQSFLAKIERALNPISTSWAVPSCQWSTLISSCVGNAASIHFDHCSSPLAPQVAIEGSMTLFWEGASCCTSQPLNASSETPCSYTRRTVTKDGVPDPLVRSIGSHSLTLDTESFSGFSTPKQGGFEVICKGKDSQKSCLGERQVSILGAHYVGNSTHAKWDHTVSTDQSLTLQGQGANRQILEGTIRVQHNLAQFVSITKITSPLRYSSNCCLPSGGEIQTSYEGGPYDGKTETLTFGPGCGNAHMKGSKGQGMNLSFQDCL